MRCLNCKEEMGKTIGQFQYRECGLDSVWLEDWELYSCPKCPLRMPILPGRELMKQAITRELVQRHERMSGDEIVYLRKALGLKAADLAETLGFNRVTISRWENDHERIDAFADFKLRMEAIDRILPEERGTLRDRVTLILQRGYKPEQTVEKISLNYSSVAAAEFAAAGL
jgi:transcriptional regulator with XRE-family HTH domain